ncbi:MAG: hypothetical protein GEV10_02765 [Streptosporangiales bacterium]|nr:hypothetical protein [Streptosporangiales bacterium]
MRINPTIEEATRTMLNHAVRGELEELRKKGASLDEGALREALGLCLAIAAHVTVDVCGGERPSEADLRTLADNVAKAETEFKLDATEIHRYLARSVFGGESLDQVFSSEDAASLPFLATGSILASYSPDGREWWDYLDAVESAIEATPESTS